LHANGKRLCAGGDFSTKAELKTNGRVLGEEALTKSLIELQMFNKSTNVK
jgi:hypothetical protein